MAIPTPEERPDLYDSYDVPKRGFKPSAAYFQAAMPASVHKALQARRQALRVSLSDEGLIEMTETVAPVDLTNTWPADDADTMVLVVEPPEGLLDPEGQREYEVNVLRKLADLVESEEISPGSLFIDMPVRQK